MLQPGQFCGDMDKLSREVLMDEEEFLLRLSYGLEGAGRRGGGYWKYCKQSISFNFLPQMVYG